MPNAWVVFRCVIIKCIVHMGLTDPLYRRGVELVYESFANDCILLMFGIARGIKAKAGDFFPR